MIPIKNGDGRFVADEHTLDALEAEGRGASRGTWTTRTARPATSPGIANAAGNVVGLMPHPEHAIDDLTGPYPGPATDGLPFFTSILKSWWPPDEHRQVLRERRSTAHPSTQADTVERRRREAARGPSSLTRNSA